MELVYRKYFVEGQSPPNKEVEEFLGWYCGGCQKMLTERATVFCPECGSLIVARYGDPNGETASADPINT